MITVAVIIPTLHNKVGGYEALQSIQGGYDICWTPIIIDNWRNPRSVTESWNLGFEIAIQMKVDYILCINDDVLFSPWTLSGLVQTFQKAPSDVGMVTGLNMRDHLENPEDIFMIDPPSVAKMDLQDHPDFSCFMMTRKSYLEFGTFDENFAPAYFEDNDAHYRLKLLGMRAVSTSWAPFYHYGSVTQNFDPDNPTVKPEQYLKNQAYYQKKWGGLQPGMEVLIHPYGDPNCRPNTWRRESAH